MGRRVVLSAEHLENRTMLTAAVADIVFLVDESGSSSQPPISEWIGQSLAPALAAAFDDDVDGDNFGLVGFGSTRDIARTGEFAHSQIVNTTVPPADTANSLFGDITQFTLATASLVRDGGNEDGWDAIEHAIAEYPIREGAVPVFVLVETEGPREAVNDTLTRSGTLAALASKNAILNVVTPNAFAITGINSLDTLGVEADGADGDINGQHTVYVRSGANFSFGNYDDDSPIDQIPSAAEDEYIRLAWDTGGAAWNLDAFTGGLTSDSTLALNEAIADSIVRQIKQATTRGLVHRTHEVVAAINFGGPAVGEFQSGTGSSIDHTQFLTQAAAVFERTNSIPSGIPDEIFDRSRINSPSGGDALSLSVTTTNEGAALPDGDYVVELYFFPRPFSNGADGFDVGLEGETVLQGYSIADDHASAITWVSSFPEQYRVDDSLAGSIGFKVVKRYHVTVNGGDGLQIDLTPESPTGRALIAGVRVLEAPVAGDYNLDGKAESADYGVWRDAFDGGPVPGFPLPDGDGSGEVDIADFVVWKQNHGEVGATALTAYEALIEQADYNNDGAISILDENLFAAAVIEDAYNPDFDADNDQFLDMSDIEVFQRARELYDSVHNQPSLATLTAPGAFSFEDLPRFVRGSDDPPVIELDQAPTVVGLSLSSSTGVVRDFGASVGSGEQLRSVAADDVDSVSVVFSEEVIPWRDALTVTNLDGVSPTAVVDFVYNIETRTATWVFDAPLAEGRTLLTLSDSIIDLQGDALDGEFWNPWSLTDIETGVFPSGNGYEGGEFRFHFTVLADDFDYDNIDGATDYTNWPSTEPGAIYVSTTVDAINGDLSYGDVSLREAVQYANAAGTPTSIYLVAGMHALTRVGAEQSDASYNDLEIAGEVTIIGEGPGVSNIRIGWPQGAAGGNSRLFTVIGSGAELHLNNVTLSGGVSYVEGQAIYAHAGSVVSITDSAVAQQRTSQGGTSLQAYSSEVTVRRSVFTNNSNSYASGATVDIYGTSAAPSTLTIGESIFALNYFDDVYGNGGATYNVRVDANVNKVNQGRNLLDNDAGGFFDTTPGTGDYLGSPNYVVTTVADTFDHANDAHRLSIREAVDLANQTAGAEEIWLPAWAFTLTRDRQSYGGGSATDVDVAFGDLDVSDDLVVRGVQGRTRIAWMPGVVDEVFDLLGDYNDDGQADHNNVSAADYTVWDGQDGSGSGTSADWEVFSADGDDDGDVDQDDYDVWLANHGNSLDLFEIDT